MGDMLGYFSYADALTKGLVPYRDYRVEYPILAFPLFLIPRLITADVRRFALFFALELSLFNALAIWLVVQWLAFQGETRRIAGRLAWYTACLTSLCPLAVYRFDLAPAAITFASCYSWFRSRSAVGGALAAIGGLMKVFPCAIVAPATAWEWGGLRAGRCRGLIAFTIAMAAGGMAWAALSCEGVLSSLGYHLGRGVEAESLYSGLAIGLSRLTGSHPSITYGHGCWEIIGVTWLRSAAKTAIFLQAAAILAVMVRALRSRGNDPMRDATAALLAFVLFGKVISPQYLIWLIPFVAVLKGRIGLWGRMAFLPCCVLTTAIFPWNFLGLIRLDATAVAILNLRNALLVILWGLLLFGPSPWSAGPKVAAAEDATAGSGSSGP